MVKSPDGGFYVGDGLMVDSGVISAAGGGPDSKANLQDIYLVHMYSVYGPSGDSIGMRSSMSVDDIIPLIRKNKLLIGYNSDHHTMTPLFIYDFDADKKELYWYQQDVIYNKMLMYKQTDEDIVEFQSN